ncbi:MAG TPA: hypothetical protein VMH85_02655 [Terriglobales bacterium]|nr:hypothetical protein [Terriglobales bacterium]
MKNPQSYPYRGLLAIPGIKFLADSATAAMVCPICECNQVAMIDGKVSFSATMGGEDLLEEPLALVPYVCADSHLFFLREQDIACRRSFTTGSATIGST